VPHVVSVEPIFAVSDLALAVAHYERLGFRISHHDDGYAFALRDHVTIHLAHASDPDDGAGHGFIYLQVDDPDAFAVEWKAAGVDLVEPQDTEWGMREGSVRDPDGNLIRFGSALRR